ncbi:MAG: 2Fe-2S iron-sulfur cluster-binding protein [Hyphomicrobiaceae bacterium]
MRIFWNGDAIDARAGDTVAEALLRRGIKTIGVTRKRHRPLGLSGSFVQGVLAEVDGRPNVRLDQTLARDGLRITAQNVWPGPKLDLLKAARLLPAKRVRGGFEHPNWLPSGTKRFERWEELMSFLAGEGRLSPEFPATRVVPGQKVAADTTVVGGGRAGREEAARLANAGKRVVLISRRAVEPGLPSSVTVLAHHEAFGAYRQGKLIGAAPLDPDQPAAVIETAELVLATGRRSCPPVVPGNELPGVMDAPTAQRLAARGIDLGRVVVLGTGAEAAVADNLRDHGQGIVATGSITSLKRIVGRGAVAAVDIGRRVGCDTLVHAGPWIADPNLGFQAVADGRIRLLGAPLPPHIRVIGGAALPDEPVHVGSVADIRKASICPCMDVMGAEILDLLATGMTHVEELKRQTSCGMGPCQGLPCWELLRGVLRKVSDGRLGDDRPSHRGPRRGLTVAQAAGLHGLVEPQR